jgi:hypothetical protein
VDVALEEVDLHKQLLCGGSGVEWGVERGGGVAGRGIREYKRVGE